jgi:predicted nucleotidyltransferase
MIPRMPKPGARAAIPVACVLLTHAVHPAPRTAAQVAQAPAATIRLVDVAAQAGLALPNVHGSPARDYIIDTNGNGAGWFDYDADGDIDALIVNGSTRENMARGGDLLVALYRNDGQGRFSDVTADSGLAARGWGMGTCIADYDNDGFQDVYVTAFGPNVLYRNNGNGTFADVTTKAGVGDPRWSTGCAFGDYDKDGDVDLYVANYLTFDDRTAPKPGSLPNCQYGKLPVFCGPLGLPGEPDALYRNEGNATFRDVTAAAGIVDPGHYGFGVVFSDLDDDGWPDIFVANDSVANLWFRNRGDGTFAEEALVSGLALSGDGRAQAGMGVDTGDYDGDGRLDVVVTNFTDDYNTLYANQGERLFSDVTHTAGLGVAALRYMGWGVGLVDVDNDGLLDLFVANGHVYPAADRSGLGTTFLQRKLLFRNLGTRRFRDVSRESGSGLLIEKASRGAAFGDYDGDGDVDVLVVNLSDRPTLLRNDTSGGHWISLRLQGTTSNRDGIGATVRVTAGSRTQLAEVRSGGSYLSHNDMRTRFGLGTAARVDRVEIRWPGGLVQTAEGLDVDRFYVVEEGKGVR